MEENIATLVCVAKSLARTILENGGEIYRVEDAIYHMKKIRAISEIDVLALPTGVFIAITAADGKISNAMCRFKTRGLDLGAVDAANSIARTLADGSLSADEAILQLEQIGSRKKMRPLFTSLIAAITVGCFCVLLGGGVFEFFVCALCAFLSQFTSRAFDKNNMYNFMVSLVCGALCAIVATMFCAIFKTGSLNIIIGSSILPLLPGMTLVSSIRDCVHGDLLSGAARLGDVLVIALALASGIGAVLWVYSLMGGAV